MTKGFLLVGVALLVLGAKPVKPAPGISLQAKAWTVTIGRGTPQHPTPVGTGWFLDIPQLVGDISACNATLSCPSLNYVTTTAPDLSAKSLLTLSVQVAVTGASTIYYQTEPWNTCGGPATVRFLLQAPNDWSTDFGRWWSNLLHLDLVEGFGQLNVPLTPDQWTSVYGTRASDSAAALSAFHTRLRGGWIGLTFGGGCFFGHGVVVGGGTARFTLLQFLAS